LSHSLVVLRQNTNTKIFFKNSDTEVDYASQYIDSKYNISKLPVGTAIAFNSSWGSRKFEVRPSLSKVFELSTEQTRNLVGRHSDLNSNQKLTPISDSAVEVLNVITKHHMTTSSPINISELIEKSGITSNRKILALIEALEDRGLIRTFRLESRGRPRMIIPTYSPVADEEAD